MKACPHCLSPITDDSKGEPRSLDQLRRYFAMLRAVHFHWPETHGRQFSDETELRKWLQMKAGHQEIGASIPLVGVSKDKAMFIAEAAIRAAGSYALPYMHGATLIVYVPKSIAFHKLDHATFCKLNNEIDAVIIAETGLDPQRCLEEFKVMA